MSEIKDSGERTEFSSGAVRDMHGGKGRTDLLPMCAILRLSKHYENGCEKYGERNWEKGIPAHSYVDSALRHIMKYMDGYDDEDHLAAALWNLCGLAWTEEKKPEQMDIPARKGKRDFCYSKTIRVPNNDICVTCKYHENLPTELPCGSCIRSNSEWKTDADYYQRAKAESTGKELKRDFTKSCLFCRNVKSLPDNTPCDNCCRNVYIYSDGQGQDCFVGDVQSE